MMQFLEWYGRGKQLENDAMSEDHLKALDLARDGRWEESHKIVQAHSDSFSNLIHAYLHRIEGDESNAAYWYQRAGEEFCQLSLEDELKSLYERCKTN